MNKENMLHNIIFARYSRDARVGLDSALATGIGLESLRDSLLEQLDKYTIQPAEYAGYEIPRSVLENRKFFLSELKIHLEKIKSSTGNELQGSIYALFVEHNRVVKYSVQGWFLLSPGMSLEILTVKDSLDLEFKQWLKSKFNINVGDQVLHRHVVSNNERGLFRQLGMEIPHDHWDESYYRDGMRTIQQIVKASPVCKGVISEASWIYNPELYEIAPDGKPYASFVFLKDDDLVGQRFKIGEGRLDNEFAAQYKFATRSERRLKYVEQGDLGIDMYGVFYPRSKLLKTKF